MVQQRLFLDKHGIATSLWAAIQADISRLPVSLRGWVYPMCLSAVIHNSHTWSDSHGYRRRRSVYRPRSAHWLCCPRKAACCIYFHGHKPRWSCVCCGAVTRWRFHGFTTDLTLLFTGLTFPSVMLLFLYCGGIYVTPLNMQLRRDLYSKGY